MTPARLILLVIAAIALALPAAAVAKPVHFTTPSGNIDCFGGFDTPGASVDCTVQEQSWPKLPKKPGQLRPRLGAHRHLAHQRKGARGRLPGRHRSALRARHRPLHGAGLRQERPHQALDPLHVTPHRPHLPGPQGPRSGLPGVAAGLHDLLVARRWGWGPQRPAPPKEGGSEAGNDSSDASSTRSGAPLREASADDPVAGLPAGLEDAPAAAAGRQGPAGGGGERRGDDEDACGDGGHRLSQRDGYMPMQAIPARAAQPPGRSAAGHPHTSPPRFRAPRATAPEIAVRVAARMAGMSGTG